MTAPTSRVALEHMTNTGKRLSIRERVMLLISHSCKPGAFAPGLTDEQLFELIRPQVPGVKEGTIRARRCELRDAGKIEESGTRETKSGERGIVWVVAQLVTEQQRLL